MPVARTNADTIVVCIKDVLLCMNRRIQDTRGQCYDGCSTMTATKNGVAAQIKKLNEKCLLTHCYCPSLNLAFGDSIKNIPLLKDTLDMAYLITELIKKRQVLPANSIVCTTKEAKERTLTVVLSNVFLENSLLFYAFPQNGLSIYQGMLLERND